MNKLKKIDNARRDYLVQRSKLILAIGTLFLLPGFKNEKKKKASICKTRAVWG